MTKLHSTNLANMAKGDEQTIQELRKTYRGGRWVRYVVRPLLMTLLVVSLMVAMIAVIRMVSLDERWSLLIPLFFVIALEAIYTTNWIKHPARLRLDRSTYRAAEIFLIVIVVRLVTWVIFDGGLFGIDQIADYLSNPLSFFLNGPFLITLLLAMVCWRLANVLAEIFLRLEVSEFELQFYSLPLAQRKARSDDQPILTGRHYMVMRFTQYWLWGGLLIVFAVGLSTLEIRSLDVLKNPLAIGRLGLQPGLLIILLLYFGIGFYLLSQAKLMELNARWLLNDIKTDDQMKNIWQRSSLLILLLVGLIAAFLPIGPNLAIGRILVALVYVISFIVYIIIFLLSIPLFLLFSLFSGQPVEERPPLPPLNPEMFAEAAPPETSPLLETAAMVFSSAFWAIFIVIAAMALLFFLRERKGSMNGGSAQQIGRRFWAWLIGMWRGLWHRASTMRLQLPQLMSAKDDSEPATSKRRRWRFFRIGAL
ncbi:MAG: hypothetical protein R3293_25675, partial [Candidatus Promineifilaceae bacterium]|nr:hypothetical protein [Candidatus Promineifilaceae bacterium]